MAEHSCQHYDVTITLSHKSNDIYLTLYLSLNINTPSCFMVLESWAVTASLLVNGKLGPCSLSVSMYG